MRFGIQKVIVLTCIFTADAAFGQPLVPLSDLDNENVEPSYYFVRCAGFNLANLEWSGERTLDQTTVERIKMDIELLMHKAAIVRARRTGDDLDWVSKIVLRDVSDIADLYLQRYKQNYASSGNAWQNDALWRSDLLSCKIGSSILRDGNE